MFYVQVLSVFIKKHVKAVKSLCGCFRHQKVLNKHIVKEKSSGAYISLPIELYSEENGIKNGIKNSIKERA